MKNSVLKYSVCFLIALIALSVSAQVKLTVSMDSAKLLMGKVTPLHIELQAPADAGGYILIPKDSLNEKVEVAKIFKADTTHPDKGRQLIQQTILLQSFDSGLYRLKPILYISGSETIASESLPLQVIPVPVDTLSNIHDFADVVDVKRKFTDYLPDFLVDYGLWIIALIIALGILGGFLWYKKRLNKGIPLVKPKIIPPYEEAISALTTLHDEKLCEAGKEKEYYTRLTDILRNYLARRFGINAMEMTSRQILRQLETTSEAKLSRKYMDDVLKIADFVKFAKVRPLPDDNVQAYNSAMQFVEDTKPVPVPESPQPETKTKQ